MAEYRLEAIKSAYVDSQYPDTNFSQEATLSIKPLVDDRVMYGFIGFEDIPAEAMLQIQTGIKAYVHASNALDGTYTYDMRAYTLWYQWDEKGITYNNHQRDEIWVYRVPLSEAGWYSYSIEPNRIYTNNGIRIELYKNSGYPAQIVEVDSSRADIEYRPYLILETREGKPRVKPVAPMNKIITSNEELRFEWDYSNEAQKATQKNYEIQISDDAISWSTLKKEETNNNYTSIAVSTMPITTKYWRVKVTSIRGVDSEWSETAKINIIAAPIIKIDNVFPAPRPTVEWNVEGQRGYQVIIGNHNSGPIYGTQTLYKSPIYISDGIVQIGVRAVSEYGIWSNWVYEDVVIKNIPSASISLNATATHRAVLEWSDGIGGAEYTVLRDGVEIATVSTTTYVDELVIGKHTYQVRRNEGDYYTLSNAVELEMKCKYPMITATNNVDWIEIKDSLTATPGVQVARRLDVHYMHYAGRKLPIAETDGFGNETLDFSAAFRKAVDAKKLLALGGRDVCYKDPRDNIIIGNLENLSGSIGRMYSELSGTIVATEEKL